MSTTTQVNNSLAVLDVDRISLTFIDDARHATIVLINCKIDSCLYFSNIFITLVNTTKG